MQAIRSRKAFSTPQFLLLLTVILLGFAVRVYRLDYQSIWWDEARSITTARAGLGAIWAMPKTTSYYHPPLHSLLLATWGSLAGYSAFAVRYLSLIFSVLTIPVATLVAKDILGRRAALASAGIVALAPVYMAYSQETRVYALLPIIYLLMTWILMRLLAVLRAGRAARPVLWVALAGLEVVGLYAHLFMAFGVAAINLILLVRWLRRRDVDLRWWIGSQASVGVLFGGWVLRIFLNINILETDVGNVAEQTDMLGIISRLMQFVLGGVPALEGGPPFLVSMVWVLLGTLIAAAAVLLWHRSEDSARGREVARRAGKMLIYSLVPLPFALIIYRLWPQAQPRYILAYTGPLFLAIGGGVTALLGGDALARSTGGMLIGVLAMTFGAGLWATAFDADYFKDDARGVTAYLEQQATANDTIVVSAGDNSVPYYYDGPATVVFTDDDSEADRVVQMQSVAAGSSRVFLADWEVSTTDLRGVRAFLLERAGQLIEWRDMHGLNVSTYAIDGPVEGLPALKPFDASSGPLTLTGVWAEPIATTDNAVTVALGWRLDTATDAELKASVRLIDPAGREVSHADVLLRDETNILTTGWPPGMETVNYYVVPVPVGSPPGDYTLSAVLYDAATLERLTWQDGSQALAVGAVQLEPGTDFDRDPYRTWADTDWSAPAQNVEMDGLSLDAIALQPGEGLPGQPLEVLLRWRATEKSAGVALPSLSLSADGVTLVEADPDAALDSTSPPDWPAGTVVVERRTLTYPPARGSLDIQLDTSDGLQTVASVSLDESALVWEPPKLDGEVGVRFPGVGTLLGYQLDGGSVRAGEPFSITLIWQAGDEVVASPYTVTVQALTPDGRLIAQHDGQPVDDARPTTSWVPGEVVADTHTLTFSDSAYSGHVQVIVGLYDPQTVVRLMTASGEDHAVLIPEMKIAAP